MRIIDLKQNTPEWLEFRRLHLGASDAAVILGLNPWKTKKQLWEEKMFGWEEPMTDKMKEGQKMEPIARLAFQKETGLVVNPIVGVHDELDWMSASFDGLTEDLRHGIEIKCGRSSHKLALMGKIPNYYYPQLQHQICVADLPYISYYSYYEQVGKLMIAHRNQEFIKDMIEKELAFWETLK
jgi:putative phage-type endonuclease